MTAPLERDAEDLSKVVGTVGPDSPVEIPVDRCEMAVEEHAKELWLVCDPREEFCVTASLAHR
jgi:hypothetical protein